MTDDEGRVGAVARGRHGRGTLEFERVAFFSDAIYAIALTLLVVGLDVPRIADTTNNRDLWTALGDEQSSILMFFISFAVLGGFWLHHHSFFSALAAVDRPTTMVNLVYLAFIAFLPFPSGILGDYADNSVGVAVYAVCIAVTAVAGVTLSEVARRRGLLRYIPSAEEVRFRIAAAAVPVIIFLGSVPIAFVSPTAALYSWLLLIPADRLVSRWAPPETASMVE